MPFGLVNGVGRGMGVLGGDGDRRRRGAGLGINVPLQPLGTFGTWATWQDLFVYNAMLVCLSCVCVSGRVRCLFRVYACLCVCFYLYIYCTRVFYVLPLV